ncbi:Histidine kinase [Rhodovastum atsumiense]|nr:PAS domain-containing protein [Rhodovastum atsumiense]CAH2602835.1 Histidine kinase [Rhodovastum atsumiense]
MLQDMLPGPSTMASVTAHLGLLEALSVAIYTTDAEGRITAYNEAAVTLWGWRPPLGTTRWCGSWRLFRPDGTPMAHDDCPIAAAMREGRPLRGNEAIAERPDGTRVAFISYPAPLRDPVGRVLGMVNVLVDISGRKTTEAALAASEARLRLATECAGIGTWEEDLRTGRGQWSAESMALLGIDRANFTADDCVEPVHPADRAMVAEAWQRAVEGGEHFDLTFRSARPAGDGSERWLLARGRAERDAAGVPVRAAGVLFDVTARHRVEAALRESEARFRASQELSPVAFAILRAVRAEQGAVADFEFEYANPACLGMLRAGGRQLQGRRLLSWLPDSREHPLLFPRFVRMLTEGRGGGEVELHYNAAGISGWFRTGAVAIDAERIAVSAEDITQRKETREALARSHAELERLVEERTTALLRESEERRYAEKAMRQSENLAALGQLAGGVAHDFNNILQIVENCTTLLDCELEGDVGAREYTEMIFGAAERGNAITRRLLAFAHRGDLRRERIDPVTLLGDVRHVLAHTLASPVVVHFEIRPNLPALLADRGQLETVLINLAVNARDAMPEGGTLTFVATVEEIQAGQAHLMGLDPGPYVRLTLRDTGVGMDETTLTRACEPFFTTKQRGHGTGLGLSMARGFAEQSGGALLIESAPGQGTIVTLWLPRADRAPEQASPRPGGMKVLGAARRVLFVDDEGAIRRTVGTSLQKAGFVAHLAEGGWEALALLDAGETVDVMVTDLVMPGMSGIGLIHQAQVRRPGLPAILLTGYVGEDVQQAMRSETGVRFALLRKPISVPELIDRISEVLAGDPAALPEPRPGG